MPIISSLQLEDLTKFFDELEKANVRYVVLRGFKDLPERIRTDLDIACHPDDQIMFYKVAKECLTWNSYPFISSLQGKNIIYWDFQVKDRTELEDEKDRCKLIRMDLYNGIYWFHGRQYYPGKKTVDYIFENRVKGDYFYIPSPEVDVIFNILRCVYDKKTGLDDKKVGTKYRDIIDNLMNDVSDIKLKNTVRSFYPSLTDIADHLVDEVITHLKNRDWVKLTKTIMHMRTH